MPRQVFGLGSGGLRRKVQWLACVGFEVLGHGRVSEMVAQRRGTNKAQLGVEGDEATVEGAIVEGVEGDGELLSTKVGSGSSWPIIPS